MTKKEVSKFLGKHNYYIKFLEVGQTVSKVNGKKFADKNKLSQIVKLNVKHPITSNYSCLLSNGCIINNRQLKPVDVNIKDILRG